MRGTFLVSEATHQCINRSLCPCSCTRCHFPAAPCIASVIFCALAGALLWRAALHMIRRVINRALQRRLRVFLGLFVSGERHMGLPSCHFRTCVCPPLWTLVCALLIQQCGRKAQR